MPRRIASALPSWIIAVAGTVFAVTIWSEQWETVISASMGASIVLSFGVQLALQRRQGLVNRLAFTTAGSLIVGAVGIVVAWSLYGLH